MEAAIVVEEDPGAAAGALQPAMVFDLGMITFTAERPDVWYMVALEKNHGLHSCRCGLESSTSRMSCSTRICRCFGSGKSCFNCFCVDCGNPEPITEQDIANARRTTGCVVTIKSFGRDWIGRYVVLAGTAVYKDILFPATLTGRLVSLAQCETDRVKLGLQPISVGSQSTAIQQALQDAPSTIPAINSPIGPILVSVFTVMVHNQNLSGAMNSGLYPTFMNVPLEVKPEPSTFTITGHHEEHAERNVNIVTNLILFHDIRRQHPFETTELKVSKLVDNRKYVIETNNAAFCYTGDSYVVSEPVATNAINAYMDELDGIWDYSKKGILCNHGALNLLLTKDNFCSRNTFNLFIPMSQKIALYEPFAPFMYR